MTNPTPDPTRILVLSILPVDDLDTLTPSDEELRRADFLVYTIN